MEIVGNEYGKHSPFNALCRLAERYLDDGRRWGGLMNKLRDVPLFAMPGDPGDFLPRGYTEDRQEFHNEHFFLPFQTIAVEDDLGVVILMDLQKDQSGLKGERRFLMYSQAQSGSFVMFGLSKAEIAFGYKFGTTVSIDFGTFISTDERVIEHYGMNELMGSDPFALSCSQNVGTAYQEIMLLNTPSRFVVEVVPAKSSEGIGKSKKIPRKQNRPVFTLLTPNEIRKLLVVEGETEEAESNDGAKRTSPAPHPRCRHFRTLRDDRFTGKKGQMIEVKATWVGPEEKIINGKRYKVRLDL